MRLFMSSRALKMLGEGLAAEIELYECFWGNLVIYYTPTQLVGTLMNEINALLARKTVEINKHTYHLEFFLGSDYKVCQSFPLFLLHSILINIIQLYFY